MCPVASFREERFSLLSYIHLCGGDWQFIIFDLSQQKDMLSSSQMLSKMPLKLLRMVRQYRPGGVQGPELCLVQLFTPLAVNGLLLPHWKTQDSCTSNLKYKPKVFLCAEAFTLYGFVVYAFNRI